MTRPRTRKAGRSARIVGTTIGVAVLAIHGAPAAAHADDCANAQFRPGAAAALPDCRAWEQISPVDKNGTDVVSTASAVAVNGGNGVYFNTGGLIPGGESVLYDTAYVSGRSASDWTTVAADAPMGPSGFLQKSVLGLSEDGTKAVVISDKALAPGAIEGGSNLYIRDLTQPKSYRLVVANSSQALYSALTGMGGQGNYIAGTDDLSSIAFLSSVPLLPGVPTGKRGLYLWHNDELMFASRLPDGSVPNLSAPVETPDRSLHRLSDDGTRLWFTTSFNNSGALYQYVAGEGTTLISRSHVAGDNPATAVSISTPRASADGRSIFFGAYETLATNSSAGGAYRWTADGSLTNIIPAPSYVDIANVLETSADGRIVWYKTRQGDLRVADLQASQDHLVATFERPGTLYGFGMSPNGRRVTFIAVGGVNGVPSSDPSCFVFGDPGSDGFCRNVYSWDLDEPSQAVECLSCGPTGMIRHPSPPSFGIRTTGFDGRVIRPITDDGRVYFDSADRLVPADGNDVQDVYEYKPGRGLALLTPGVSGNEARITDVSVDTSDVFFVTSDSLVPQDSDVLADLYTARVGGGFVGQQVAPKSAADGCSGEACRPAPSPVPGSPVPGGPFRAPVAGPSPSFRVQAPNAKTLRSAAKSGRLSLPIKVTDAGSVRATLTGTIGGRKDRTVASGSAKATKAGTVKVTLKLSSAARAQLRRTGKLSVRLRVSYSEDISSYAKALTFKTTKTTTKKGGSR